MVKIIERLRVDFSRIEVPIFMETTRNWLPSKINVQSLSLLDES